MLRDACAAVLPLCDCGDLLPPLGSPAQNIATPSGAHPTHPGARVAMERDTGEPSGMSGEVFASSAGAQSLVSSNGLVSSLDSPCTRMMGAPGPLLDCPDSDCSEIFDGFLDRRLNTECNWMRCSTTLSLASFSNTYKNYPFSAKPTNLPRRGLLRDTQSDEPEITQHLYMHELRYEKYFKNKSTSFAKNCATKSSKQ